MCRESRGEGRVHTGPGAVVQRDLGVGCGWSSHSCCPRVPQGLGDTVRMGEGSARRAGVRGALPAASWLSALPSFLTQPGRAQFPLLSESRLT